MRNWPLTSNDTNRVFISYIGDLEHSPPDDVLLVEQDADYVQACHKLSRHRKTDPNFRIWVRSKNLYSWLRNFTEQIDCPSAFEEKTARLLLAEQWNVTLPDWLTDAEVLYHHLLEIEVTSSKLVSFETRLLAHFLGTAFELDTLSNGDIVSVIKGLISEDAKAAFKDHPLLARSIKTKCEQWAEESSETWTPEFCKRLPEDFTLIWHWLSLWSGLHGYPGTLLEFVLAPDQVVFVRRIPPGAVSDLPVESTAREQILTQIELLFDEIRQQVTSSNEFQKIVGWTSGRLSREYQIILGILKSNQWVPTASDIKVAQEKFKSCPGVSENQLNALMFCVQPSHPTLLGKTEEWNIEEWVRWTTGEYTPYRAWQVRNGHYDEDLEQTVARFSDWYTSEYTSIHKNPDYSVAHCLREIASSNSENELTIVLLVDCLPLSFVGILDTALRNEGLSRHYLKYRFAGLPTITEYNKNALLAGNWQDKAGNYEDILKVRSASEWGGRNVVYLGNLKAMAEMATPQGATTVVLNLTDGDELLHSDVESKNTTYEDELHRLFLRVAEATNQLSQEWDGPREHISVYVVTDHGACRILEEEKRSFDSKVVKKLFENEKYRFSVVSEDQKKQIPENLWGIGHQFKRPFAEENTTFFLPRGHNTVRNSGPAKGYMHGGVTPEEVIVPTACYRMVKMARKPLAVRFMNLDIAKDTGRAKFYVQRVVTLELELQNANSTEISLFRTTVVAPEADLKSAETVTIPAESEKRLKISCYFKKSAVGQRPLEIEIAYEIAGEQRTLPVVIESEFKSAMTGGFSLRDL